MKLSMKRLAGIVEGSKSFRMGRYRNAAGEFSEDSEC